MTLALALVCWLGLPWFAAAVSLASDPRPSHRRGPARVDPLGYDGLAVSTMALGVALGGWLIVPELLARTVGLNLGTAWTTSLLLVVVSLAVIFAPSHRRGLRRVWRLVLGPALLCVLISLGTWWPVGHTALSTSWSPLGSTPWYYWNLAQQVASAHRLPATSYEWGTTVPFLGDYHFFSTSTAAFIVQAPGSGPGAIRAVTVLTVLVVGIASASFARSIGAGRIASLAAIPITVGTGVASLRLTSYRPEALGLGMTLMLVACWILWLRTSRASHLVVTLVVAVALSGVHGIALLLSAILAGAAAVAWVRQPWRSYLRSTAVGGLILAAGAGLGSVLLAPGGAVSAHLPDRGGLADETWQFVRSISGLAMTMPPANGLLAHRALDTSYRSLTVRYALAAAVVIAAVVLVWRARQHLRERRVVSFYALALLGLGLVMVLFLFGWQSYVPRRTGALRIVQETTLLVGPFIAAACPLGRLRVRLPSSVTAPRLQWLRDSSTDLVVGALLLVLALTIGLMGTHRVNLSVRPQRPEYADYIGLKQSPIEPNARVLANAYTEGYLAQVVDARGILEGRAPYTFPEILRRANRLLEESRGFFAHPRVNAALLVRRHVDYVVVSLPHTYSLGTVNVFYHPPNLRNLAKVRRLTLVDKTPGLLIYKVVSPTTPH